MANERVVNYIKDSLSRGDSLDKIKQELQKVGWKEDVINEAVRETSQSEQTSASQGPQRKLPKISKKLLIGAAALFLLLIISVALYALSNRSTTGQTDCGTDYECFISAAEACQQATVNATLDSVIGNREGEISKRATTRQEIRGQEEDACVFYISTQTVNLEFPEGISEETINSTNTIMKRFEGKEATCRIETGSLVQMLEKWNGGRFSESDLRLEACTQNYFRQES